MLSTGEIIKILLDEKGLHPKDLARITDLKEASILNVLYNRTNKAEYLNRISKALDIPLETLLKAKKTDSVQTQIYERAAKIVFLELEKLNITELPSKILIEYITNAYENLTRTQSEESTAIYISGMIAGHIKFGTLNRKTTPIEETS